MKTKQDIIMVSGATLLVAWVSLQPSTSHAQLTFQFNEVTDPPLPAVNGIDNAGSITGNYFDANNILLGFIKTKGVVTDVTLPLDVAPIGVSVQDVNNAGTSVGGYPDLNGGWHSFIRTDDGAIEFPPEAFPSGPAPWTYMFHINSQGAIVGFAGPGADPTVADWRAFLWKDGKYTILDIPGEFGIALGINDHNDIVGWFASGTGPAHGYLKRGNIYKVFDVPGAAWTNPFGINNKGQIVGTYSDTSGMLHGFLLSDNVYYTVDFPGKGNNELWDINDHGQAVGTYEFGYSGYVVTIAQSRCPAGH